MVFRALKRFELLKPAYAERGLANQSLRIAVQRDSAALAGQGRLIGWYKENYAQEQGLRQNADRTGLAWKGKARRRGVLVFLEAVGLALAGYVIVTR